MLFLWPGMSNGTGDLVQTTLEAWPDNSWCGAKKGEWCVRASLFGSFGQLDGPSSPVRGDQKVKIAYTLLSDKDTWRQEVTDADTGKQLSVFEYKSGPYMRGYGTGTECNNNCSPTVSEQRYLQHRDHPGRRRPRLWQDYLYCSEGYLQGSDQHQRRQGLED
ncbi:hypothetical protein NW754_000640 [Fusarium falciforme]|nr:hypothetical protein NW754_000640 [Fusarium falciforme]